MEAQLEEARLEEGSAWLKQSQACSLRASLATHVPPPATLLLRLLVEATRRPMDEGKVQNRYKVW
jgi:hypothetical protein